MQRRTFLTSMGAGALSAAAVEILRVATLTGGFSVLFHSAGIALPLSTGKNGDSVRICWNILNSAPQTNGKLLQWS